MFWSVLSALIALFVVFPLVLGAFIFVGLFIFPPKESSYQPPARTKKLRTHYSGGKLY